MIKVKVEKGIPVPAEKVWALIANFGDISWTGMQDITVEVEGKGVGMVRKITAAGGVGVEKIVALDSHAMTLSYINEVGNPMPVEEMRCSPRVDIIDAGNCRLSWTVTGNVVGTSDEQAEKMVTGMYTGLVDTLCNAVLKKV